MKIFNYIFLINLTIICFTYQSSAKDTNQSEIATLEQHANKGDIDAQFHLGSFYSEGNNVPQDYNKSIEWYTKAASQGNVDAQFQLGWIYSEGNGAPRDYNKAIKWYTKAANQGNLDAQLQLGWIYSEGNGAPRDQVKAQKYFKHACLHGLKSGCDSNDATQ